MAKGRKSEPLKRSTVKMTVRIPERFLISMDYLIEIQDMPSRSEVIRAAIRDFVYQRVEIATEKMKKILEAEKSITEFEQIRKEYLHK